jgi:hypothetical protein
MITLPGNRLRASNHATATPIGVATSVATTAIRNVSVIAVQAVSESSSTSENYDTGWIRNVKPYFSKIAFAAQDRRNAT